VTEARLRRKRIQKEEKVKRWRRTIALTTEYKKVHDTWAAKRRAELKQVRKASKASEKAPEAPKSQEPKKLQVAPAPVKQAIVKPKKA
jgi:hypothetical protein